MPNLFAVSLVAFEIVDRRGNRVPCGFVWANGVDVMTDRQKDLVRHHGFVVLYEIANDHQNLFPSHIKRVQWLKSVWFLWLETTLRERNLLSAKSC